MTTLSEPQKSAIRLSMSTAWNNADYDHNQITFESDLTIGWESLPRAKRTHLSEVANDLIKDLLDAGVITLADDSEREYEACNFLDYEEGDWARVTNGDDVYEFLVVKATFGAIEGDSISVRQGPGLEFERAPKPAAVPNPEVHPIIIDNLTGRIYQAQDRLLGTVYYTFGDAAGESPLQFRDWSAVKVTSAEEED